MIQVSYKNNYLSLAVNISTLKFNMHVSGD